MDTNNQPIMGKKQLIKSVLIALILGVLVLLTAVFPAEYGMDPLGIGKLFGFSKLYQNDIETVIEGKQEILVSSLTSFEKLKLEKVGSSAKIPKPVEANNPPPEIQFKEREDTIEVIVPANEGIEYKFKVLKYGSVKYEWSTDDGIVYLDFHGEVNQDNPPKNVFYESYTLAYSNNMAGTLIAPFEGKHGWYYRNETNKNITITLRLKGEYELF
ncbi:MAG: hypothetical protein BM557_07855 [Flavobacterium sp. MedPE-SWcel]|uniref:hypothetical protein n=1 Tax=uncultured Flavobacterium sp. TaxID=165435 RepID=UPI000920B2BF|nr:hypothetical protein [uncultured Flavobacterium sp.]OIQ18119.1 MAG: hypothetical protein BM557_07855 [Flavobacterium sp. MedPE-SWcel]